MFETLTKKKYKFIHASWVVFPVSFVFWGGRMPTKTSFRTGVMRTFVLEYLG